MIDMCVMLYPMGVFLSIQALSDSIQSWDALFRLMAADHWTDFRWFCFSLLSYPDGWRFTLRQARAVGRDLSRACPTLAPSFGGRGVSVPFFFFFFFSFFFKEGAYGVAQNKVS
jgi:hypothetical protein